MGEMKIEGRRGWEEGKHNLWNSGECNMQQNMKIVNSMHSEMKKIYKKYKSIAELAGGITNIGGNISALS